MENNSFRINLAYTGAEELSELLIRADKAMAELNEVVSKINSISVKLEIKKRPESDQPDPLAHL